MAGALTALLCAGWVAAARGLRVAGPAPLPAADPPRHGRDLSAGERDLATPDPLSVARRGVVDRSTSKHLRAAAATPARLEEAEEAGGGDSAAVAPVPARVREHAAAAECFLPPKAETAKDTPLTLVTLTNGVSESYQRGLRKNRLREARRFGYEYCDYRQKLDDHREAAWSKVRAIQVLFEEGRQVVVWMDADALIMRLEPFETYYAEPFAEGKDLVLARNWQSGPWLSGPFASMASVMSYAEVNTGVMMVRNSAWSKVFWDEVWRANDPIATALEWEQKAVDMYRQRHPSDFQAHVKVLNFTNINEREYDAYDEPYAHFILHGARGKLRSGDDSHKYEYLEKTYMYPGSECCS